MIFVIDAAKKPLCMCHPAKARKLLRDDKAAVYRRYKTAPREPLGLPRG